MSAVEEPVQGYHRLLIKLSGEALAGEKHTGLDFTVIQRTCASIVSAMQKGGTQVSLVIGGGNFWRGVKDGEGHVERVSADRMGMLATAMNCLAVADVFRQMGQDAVVMTAVDIQGVGERYDTAKACQYLEKGYVVLFACGTGSPFFSTDTAAVLRAAETKCDAILLAKNVDGVYSADPKVDPTAEKFDKICYDEVLSRHLAVMDSTATSLAMDNRIPVLVFALAEEGNIQRAMCGEHVGTLVTA